jgi:hypothetical protein
MRSSEKEPPYYDSGAGVIPPFKRDLLQYLLLVSFLLSPTGPFSHITLQKYNKGLYFDF